MLHPPKSLPLFKVFMAPEAGARVVETLYSGYLTQGPRVDEFESALRDVLNVDHILALNSGTSALQLALTLCRLKPGDQVLSTPMTCTATNTAIRAVGAEVVWADIDPLSGNIDPQSVDEMLTKDRTGRIKAIMGVDWAGYPCNWNALRRLADEHGVYLIEDAAHAFGAEYNGMPLGHVADFTCFSFQAIKHLTTGDGGALVCSHEVTYNRGKLLRWFGIDREQPRADFRCEADVLEPGYKYHMNDLNATIGLAQIPYVDAIVDVHRAHGDLYDNLLNSMDLKGQLWPIPRVPEAKSAHWIYTLHAADRARFMAFMTAHGITTSQVHARNDLHTSFKTSKRPLPGVDTFSSTQVNIPCGWWVAKHDVDYIFDTIQEYVKQS